MNSVETTAWGVRGPTPAHVKSGAPPRMSARAAGRRRLHNARVAAQQAPRNSTRGRARGGAILCARGP